MMQNHLKIFTELRKKGVRLTPQREMVLSVICETKGHLSAETLIKRIRTKYPYLNKSVVYRTLDLLSKLGLVDQSDFGKGYLEYEFHDHPHHHHLFCRACGKTIDIDEKIFISLEDQIREKYAFEPSLKHLVISGKCKSCKKPR